MNYKLFRSLKEGYNPPPPGKRPKPPPAPPKVKHEITLHINVHEEKK